MSNGLSDLGNTIGSWLGRGADAVMGVANQGMQIGSQFLDVATGNKSAQQVLDEQYPTTPTKKVVWAHTAPHGVGPPVPVAVKQQTTMPKKITPSSKPVNTAKPINGVGGVVKSVETGASGVVNSIANMFGGSSGGGGMGMTAIVWGVIALLVIKKL